jgi:hypothetical protein
VVEVLKSPADKEVYILALEWSESPYHQGLYRVFLRYSAQSCRWSLVARPNPSGARLATTSGGSADDPRTIAVNLLRKSFADGKLEFDTIVDAGPFEIQKKEFVPPRRVLIPTGKPIRPPRKTCEFCKHLRRPQGVAANMARIFDCGLDKWTDKERGIDPLNPRRGRTPNLNFSCSEFSPCAEMKEKWV